MSDDYEIAITSETYEITVDLGSSGESIADIPTGGSAGQAITKVTGDDYDIDWTTIDKAFVGLGEADNTADVDKPVSTAVQGELDTITSAVALNTAKRSYPVEDELKLAGISEGAEVNTINYGSNVSDLVNDAAYITIDDVPAAPVSSVHGRTGAVVSANGDYTTSEITEGSNLYYTEGRVSANTSVVANTAKRSYPIGDESKLAGISAGAQVNTINSGDNISLLVNNAGYLTSAPVTSVAGKTGVVTLNNSDVGLSNVDNTSDANKPVSTATQTALDLKANLTVSNTLAYLYANYTPASYIGREFFATDVGPNGTKMKATATMFVPINGIACIAQLALPVVRPATFTGTTNGSVTFSSAAPNAYSSCYCYAPANSITASHAAGFYWLEMSSTTAGIFYNNLYTPAPGNNTFAPASKTAFSGAVIGATGLTSEITAFAYKLNGNLLGNYGGVSSEISFNGTNVATKRLRHYIDTYQMNLQSLGTSTNLHSIGNFSNFGSKTKQIGTGTYANTAGSTQESLGYADTSNDVTCSFTIQANDALEWAVLSTAIVNVIIN